MLIGKIVFSQVTDRIHPEQFRRCVTRSISPFAVALLVPWIGVIGIGPICGFRPSGAATAHIRVEFAMWMLMAGSCNAVAFLSLIRGLQRTSVLHANVLNASQAALATAAGVLLFREPLNAWLLSGVVLTILGIASIDRPPAADEEFLPP